MTNPATPSVPAGWYPDPAGGPRSRWWDGTQWTEHYQEPYTAAAVALKAPEGTKAYNVWIWLVVLLPYATFPLLFGIDISGLFDVSNLDSPTGTLSAELALFTSPAYLGLVLGSFVTSVLVIFFAYRDWKALQQAGVPQPFHWGFVFLNLAVGPVYAIGRAVVVKRRTGHGSAVLWATIALLVLAYVVTFVWVAVLISQVTQQLSTLY